MNYEDLLGEEDFFFKLKAEEYVKKVFTNAAIQIYDGMKKIGGVLRWCHLYNGAHDKLLILNKLITYFESVEEYEICAELKAAVGVLKFQNTMKSKKLKNV